MLEMFVKMIVDSINDFIETVFTIFGGGGKKD